MNLSIKTVGAERIAQLFPAVEGFIGQGLSNTDDCTVDQVKLFLMNGTWQLLVVIDEKNLIVGCYVLSIVNSPNDRTATIVAASGKGLAGQEIFDQVCEYVKALGATRVQALAKESAARLYGRVGLKEKAILVEKRLWAE